MTTISLALDDQLYAALESLCAGQGRSKDDLLADVVRRYVAAEQLKRELQDPELGQLYQELAVEDVSLAREGMSEFERLNKEADKP
jgi:hypothetical protein